MFYATLSFKSVDYSCSSTSSWTGIGLVEGVHDYSSRDSYDETRYSILTSQ